MMAVNQEAVQDVAGVLTRVRRHIDLGQREEAFYRLREISHLHSRNWRFQCEIGIRYFQVGALDRSEWALRNCLTVKPDNAIALRFLSALLSQRGETAAAEQCAERSTLIDPIIGPSHPVQGIPNVLRIRSIKNSYQGISWNADKEINECGLRRGHFSTKDLIDRERVNLYTAAILGDNLLRHHALPPFDIIVNTVACADLKQEPLSDVARFLEKYPDTPVINYPEKVRATTRIGIAERLRNVDGVVVPKTVRLKVEGTSSIIARRLLEAGLTLPIILREVGTQTGKSVALARDVASLTRAIEELGEGNEIYAIQYFDCRGADGFHHKTRAFFVDGTFYPVANLTSDHWQIHSGDRYRVMDKLPEAQREEQAYLKDPVGYLGDGVFRALNDIAATIGLDFFGIDFTVDPEGRLVIFEANPAMRHNFDHAGNFPYTRPYLETISQAFMAMVLRGMSVSRATNRDHVPSMQGG